MINYMGHYMGIICFKSITHLFFFVYFDVYYFIIRCVRFCGARRVSQMSSITT